MNKKTLDTMANLAELKLKKQLDKALAKNLKNVLNELKKGLDRLKANPVPRTDSSVYLDELDKLKKHSKKQHSKKRKHK